MIQIEGLIVNILVFFFFRTKKKKTVNIFPHLLHKNLREGGFATISLSQTSTMPSEAELREDVPEFQTFKPEASHF